MPLKKENTPGCTTGCLVDTSVHCSYDALLTLPKFADCGGKTEFSPVDVACGLCQLGGIPVFKAGRYVQGLGTLAATGFDMENIRDPRAAEAVIRKALAYKSFTTTVTHNPDGVVFGEEQLESPETTINGAVTAAATVVFDSIAGFHVGMKVMILADDSDPTKPCCDVQLRRNITAINPATKEVTFDAPVTVADGDDVIALWAPLANCELPTASGFSSKKEYFTAYFQNFGTRISFSADSANKCDCSFDMANKLVDHELKKAYNGLADQMIKAKYLAQNIPGTETMGFIPTIQHAESTYGAQNIHSLKSIKTPVAKVAALYKIFSAAQRAGEQVSDLWVPMTQVAYDNLRMANPAFHQLRGCMPMCQSNDMFDFEVTNIKNLGKTINFYHEPYLDKIFPNRSVMLYHHSDAFHVVAPKYMANINMQAKSYENMVDMFVMEEIDPSSRKGKVNCPVEFSIWSRLAYIRMGAKF